MPAGRCTEGAGHRPPSLSASSAPLSPPCLALSPLHVLHLPPRIPATDVGYLPPLCLMASVSVTNSEGGRNGTASEIPWRHGEHTGVTERPPVWPEHPGERALAPAETVHGAGPGPGRAREAPAGMRAAAGPWVLVVVHSPGRCRGSGAGRGRGGACLPKWGTRVHITAVSLPPQQVANTPFPLFS